LKIFSPGKTLTELVSASSYYVKRIQTRLDEYLDQPSESLQSFPTSFQAPQANDIAKVQELPLRVAEGLNDSAQMAKYFKFTLRQSSYYRDAAQALGFVELDNQNKYQLTLLGQRYVKLPVHKRNRLFAERVLRHPIFKEILDRLADEKVESITKKQIAEIIREMTKLSGSTPMRRASTILNWFKWLETALGIVVVLNGEIRLLPES
jgi:hypothetical protein